MLVFAQCERAMMPMRLVAALDVQHQREETLGGKIPYGYCLAAHGVALAEYPEEQAMRCLLSVWGQVWLSPHSPIIKTEKRIFLENSQIQTDSIKAHSNQTTDRRCFV